MPPKVCLKDNIYQTLCVKCFMLRDSMWYLQLKKKNNSEKKMSLPPSYRKKKLRFREVKWFAQGHVPRTKLSWDAEFRHIGFLGKTIHLKTIRNHFFGLFFLNQEKSENENIMRSRLGKQSFLILLKWFLWL